MAEKELKCGYFTAAFDESGKPDRTYNASDLNEYFKGLISKDGIFFNVSDRCQVVQGEATETSLYVIVKEGHGRVNHHWFLNTEDYKMEFEPADVILDRKDRVIVRWDRTTRKIYLTILKGTPASNPVAPALTRNNDIYEISLATIYIKKNAIFIGTANITDERPNAEVCGWVSGLINQVDTTTLFKQYEAAQNEFLEEKAVEVDTWFDNIQNEVKATSLYREYEAVYKTVSTNEKIIPIPISINYIHNGLDILNVNVEKRHFTQGVHYTINSDGTSITLTEALSVLGTEIQFINKKSVEDSVAENVVVQVEELQERVDSLTTNNNLNYTATGTDDNIAISNIVKNFLDGTGDFSEVKDNASMVLNVNGVLGAEQLIEGQMVFDFHYSIESNRKVIVDFGNATINYSRADAINLLAIFGTESNVTIRNANIVLENLNAATLYIFHGGVIKDCVLKVDDTISSLIFGIWNAKEVSNSEIDINGVSVYGIYECDRVQFNEITTNSTGVNRAVQMSDGFYIGNHVISGNASIGTNVVSLANK